MCAALPHRPKRALACAAILLCRSGGGLRLGGTPKRGPAFRSQNSGKGSPSPFPHPKDEAPTPYSVQTQMQLIVESAFYNRAIGGSSSATGRRDPVSGCLRGAVRISLGDEETGKG
ncbi:MAG: hypothetical protein KGQ49_00465, partial [Verrucomicrobia bacterium]|nr:hypothetical protein [Verrucomicrobiota bacterium]